jgi:hypothetical protein
MAPTVITVSSRISVGELERIVRERVARDGVAALAAVSGRQRTHLLRLRARLVADPALAVYGGTTRPDGTVPLTVFAAGGPRPGWMGGPRTDVVEDPDGDYWSAPGPDLR